MVYRPSPRPVSAPAPASTTTSAPGSCPCPVCGGLQCLCRPRFFAGQLLTEEDLNRLEKYIVEKNKLHNRYLHGQGVVCGLEVECNACQGQVTVTSGYALSPCGEDIVVCHNDTVDLCALIKQCRDKNRQSVNCDPPGYNSGAKDGCQEAIEEWVLAISYDEKSSRGMTPLLNASVSSGCSCGRCSGGSSSSCGCGGSSSSSGNCGCSQAGNGSVKNGRSTHSAASFANPHSVQCEPTVICEGYRYEVYKVSSKASSGRENAPLPARFQACLKSFEQLFLPLPTANATPQQAYTWCCTVKSNIQDFLMNGGGYNCQSLTQLLSAPCPDPTKYQSGQDYLNAIMPGMELIVSEYYRYCLCSALLPPCPAPAYDSRIPLATVTVRRDNCQILRVCNWDVRQLVLTFPDLEYWLSATPLLQKLRQLLEALCCQEFQPRETLFTGKSATAGRFAMGKDAEAEMPGGSTEDFATLLFQSLANTDRIVDIQALAMATLGLSDAKGQATMTPLELGQPLQALLLHQLVSPLLQSVVPAEKRPGQAPSPDKVSSAEISDLKTQLGELQNTVKQQQELINTLSKRLNPEQ